MSKKIQENLTVEETVSAEITVDVAESTVSDKNENLSSVITEKDVMKERDIEKIEKRQRAAKITAQVFIYIFLTVMALIVVKILRRIYGALGSYVLADGRYRFCELSGSV